MEGRSRIIPNQILQIRDQNPQLIRVVDKPLLLRHSAIIALEDRLSSHHREINLLLSDNQHLAATHVALKQELDASRNEIRVAVAAAGKIREEREADLRQLMDRSAKFDAEVCLVEEMRVELGKVRVDVERLGGTRNEVLDRVHELKFEVSRAREDLVKVFGLREEIDAMSREIQRGRAAVEYEKKARAENLIQSQELEKNMISMAREVEKLRIELANAEKRERASAAAAVAANPSLGYTEAYRNGGMAYGGNTYAMAYNLHQVQQGADANNQYGQISSARTAYDIQQTHATR